MFLVVVFLVAVALKGQKEKSKVIKDDGYVFIADFQWVDIP